MTPYEHGFMNKCAEYGVDAGALLKYAEGPVKWDLTSNNGKPLALDKPMRDLGRFMVDFNTKPQTANLLMKLNDKGDIAEEFSDSIPIHDTDEYDPKDLTQNQLRLFWKAKRDIIRAMRKDKIKQVLLQIQARRVRGEDGATYPYSQWRGTTNFDKKSIMYENGGTIENAYRGKPKPVKRFEEIPEELRQWSYLDE